MTLYITPEECLTAAAESVGTMQQVGHTMRPDKCPKEAGRWLAHCLDPDHAQRLNYGQEQLVYRLACERGEHDGFRAYAESIGYRIEPIDRQAEIKALLTRAEAASQKSAELSTEAMARMKAAGLNLESV